MQSWPSVPVPHLPGEPGRLRLTDSARGLVDVVPEGAARIYVCGITPYDATHLGHAATYLAFDTLVRVWRDAGLAVTYVQNVTDIDDPLLERAARDGADWTVVAERETALFRTDMSDLRVLAPTHFVGAVEAMEEIAAMVARLLDAGAAYRVDEDVYFPVSAAKHFGEISGLSVPVMTKLAAESGGDPERAGKRHPLDPLLWRAQRPGEPAWDSPMGRGRPGWHVECTAIALNRLGERFDVQGGGSDLVFPHHEMSAAHAEAVTGQWPYAEVSVHAGMIGLNGEKMSKSRGNLVFVSHLLRDGVHPAALRLALLATHYRADRDWTDAQLPEAQDRLGRWQRAVRRKRGPAGSELLAQVRAALADDLDTPAALAAIDVWAAASGGDPASPALVRNTADALLGVALESG